MEIIVRKEGFQFIFLKDNKIIFIGKKAHKPKKGYLLYNYNNKIVGELIGIKFRLFFKLKFEVKLFCNETEKKFFISYNNLLKPKFISEFDNDFYEIYPHRGMKTSIFKNNIQIGFYEECRMKIPSKERIRVVLNNDVIEELICYFVFLIACDFTDESFTLNLGNIGPEIKKFDRYWRPN